jgi:type I restriction enzyme S subunit
MIATREDALRLVREFRNRLAEVYGERLKGVYLYGSYARGDAREDSDIDVAVVLEGPVNPYRESERTSEIAGGLSLRESCLLAPFFLTEEEYRAGPHSVSRDIVREGVPA